MNYYDKYFKLVYYMLNRNYKSLSSYKDDVVQDVFVKFYQDKENNKEIPNDQLHVINLTRFFCRKYARYLKMSGIIREEDFHVDCYRREDVSRLISMVPRPYRDVIKLKFEKELDIPEICDKLKISETCYKSRLNRALKILRGILNGQ